MSKGIIHTVSYELAFVSLQIYIRMNDWREMILPTAAPGTIATSKEVEPTSALTPTLSHWEREPDVPLSQWERVRVGVDQWYCASL